MDLMYIPTDARSKSIVKAQDFEDVIDNAVSNFFAKTKPSDHDGMYIRAVGAISHILAEVTATEEYLRLHVRTNPPYGCYTSLAHLSYHFESKEYISQINGDLLKKKFDNLLLAYNLTA